MAQQIVKRAQIYGRLAQRAVAMLRGTSYYHAAQGVGNHFVPGELAGYYNDLSHKATWAGPVDTDGIPLNEDADGNPVYIPTTVIQKAIGHWEQWLASGRTDEAQWAAFLGIMRWAVREQDERGGWPVWFLRSPVYCSVYSSMTQGEAASMLVRAYDVTGETEYLTAAERSLDLMLTPMEEGGTARADGARLVLEEFPKIPHNTVFNGWVFSLYGLYDYLQVKEHADYQDALTQTVETLADSMGQIDAGYWSYYDTDKNTASPFYQDLHVAQFDALARTFRNTRRRLAGCGTQCGRRRGHG